MGGSVIPLPRRDFDASRVGPLHGLRVLDLSRLVSGGHCTTVLGDLGADVVKVERPGVGDELRDVDIDGVAAYWSVYSRNKRSIAIDLKAPAGRELVLELTAGSDILVENFRPGKLEALGLAPETLLQANPALAVVRISGWGQTGPYAELPGFGTLAEAVAGFTLRNGYSDRAPLPAPIALSDMVTGLWAANAAQAAVLHARATGEGQVIDVSLFESLFSIMGPDGLLHRLGALPVRGQGTRASSVKGVFACADGRWVAMSAATPGLVERFFSAIGRADVLEDPRFDTYEHRLEHRDALNEIVGEWYARHRRDDALAFVRAQGLTAAPLYDVADAARDPHFAARETIVELPDRSGPAPGHPDAQRRPPHDRHRGRLPAARSGAGRAHTGDPGPARAYERADRWPSGCRRRGRAMSAAGRPGWPAWRSLLFVPADNQRYITKAGRRGADAVILDLEDAVAPSAKPLARAGVTSAAAALHGLGSDVLVRVNRPWRLLVADLEAVVAPEVTAVALSKCDHEGVVLAASELLDELEAERGLPVGRTALFVRIEDAVGLRRVDAILAASRRVVAAGIGAGDLRATLGWSSDDALRHAMLTVAVAARAAGVMPLGLATAIDEFTDLERYRTQAQRARDLGSLGAPCIHPRQVTVLNEVFAPTVEELAASKELVAAWERQAANGVVAFMHRGTFVDPAVVRRARTVLERSPQWPRATQSS